MFPAQKTQQYRSCMQIRHQSVRRCFPVHSQRLRTFEDTAGASCNITTWNTFRILRRKRHSRSMETVKFLPGWRYLEAPFSVLMCGQENCSFMACLIWLILISQRGLMVEVTSPPVALGSLRLRFHTVGVDGNFLGTRIPVFVCVG